MYDPPTALPLALAITVFYHVYIFHPRFVSCRSPKRVPPPHNNRLVADNRSSLRSPCTVGQPLLDTQHAQIFSLIDDLRAAIEDGSDKAKLVDLWCRLAQCTESHCGEEERIMQEQCYPRFDAHKAAHDQLRAHTAHLASAGGRPRNQDSLAYLRTCWSNHIRSKDMQYVPYLVWDGAVTCN